MAATPACGPCNNSPLKPQHLTHHAHPRHLAPLPCDPVPAGHRQHGPAHGPALGPSGLPNACLEPHPGQGRSLGRRWSRHLRHPAPSLQRGRHHAQPAGKRRCGRTGAVWPGRGQCLPRPGQRQPGHRHGLNPAAPSPCARPTPAGARRAAPGCSCFRRYCRCRGGHFGNHGRWRC